MDTNQGSQNDQENNTENKGLDDDQGYPTDVMVDNQLKGSLLTLKLYFYKKNYKQIRKMDYMFFAFFKRIFLVINQMC